MIGFPNAKINLGLNIVDKRPDGYHSIESCFYPVMWKEGLEIIESRTFSFNATGIPIPKDPHGNLCSRAYQLLQPDCDLPPVAIHLHKAIPIGAGLGGGSADAAETLKLLNTIFKLQLSADELEVYAARLGSDCPFFIRNQPVYATGTGTVFQPLQLKLSGYYLLLVYPSVHISTAEAYGGIKPVAPAENCRTLVESLPVQDWKEHLTNDFEGSLFPRYPVLGELKEQLYAEGALYASMTGSGSAMYGIFAEEPEVSFPRSYIVHSAGL